MSLDSVYFKAYSHLVNSHTGPVWQVAWAHPKYGHILASSSYDGKVLIWKEQQVQGAGAGSWTKVKEHTLHTASGKQYIHSANHVKNNPQLILSPGRHMSWVPFWRVPLQMGSFLS